MSAAEWSKFEAAVEPVVGRWINEMESKGIPGAALYDRAKLLVTRYTKK